MATSVLHCATTTAGRARRRNRKGWWRRWPVCCCLSTWPRIEKHAGHWRRPISSVLQGSRWSLPTVPFGAKLITTMFCPIVRCWVLLGLGVTILFFVIIVQHYHRFGSGAKELAITVFLLSETKWVDMIWNVTLFVMFLDLLTALWDGAGSTCSSGRCFTIF